MRPLDPSEVELTRAEAAASLGCGETMIGRLIERGELKARRRAGRVFVSRTSIEAYRHRVREEMEKNNDSTGDVLAARRGASPSAPIADLDAVIDFLGARIEAHSEAIASIFDVLAKLREVCGDNPEIEAAADRLQRTITGAAQPLEHAANALAAQQVVS